MCWGMSLCYNSANVTPQSAVGGVPFPFSLIGGATAWPVLASTVADRTSKGRRCTKCNGDPVHL